MAEMATALRTNLAPPGRPAHEAFDAPAPSTTSPTAVAPAAGPALDGAHADSARADRAHADSAHADRAHADRAHADRAHADGAEEAPAPRVQPVAGGPTGSADDISRLMERLASELETEFLRAYGTSGR
jgi:hypothetical protein